MKGLLLFYTRKKTDTLVKMQKVKIVCSSFTVLSKLVRAEVTTMPLSKSLNLINSLDSWNLVNALNVLNLDS